MISLEEITLKSVINLLKALLRRGVKELSKRKNQKLISAAIAELLEKNPDLIAAKANLAAVETTGTAPSPDLLRAKQMLSNVATYGKSLKYKAAKTAISGRFASYPKAKKIATGTVAKKGFTVIKRDKTSGKVVQRRKSTTFIKIDKGPKKK